MYALSEHRSGDILKTCHDIHFFQQVISIGFTGYAEQHSTAIHFHKLDIMVIIFYLKKRNSHNFQEATPSSLPSAQKIF